MLIIQPVDQKNDEQTGLPFTTRSLNDAINVFDRSAFLELRRAARLQSVLRPASRD
jgi:hypothetical protein